MSGWRAAVREVHNAGGTLQITRVSYSSYDIATARLHGLLAPPPGLGGLSHHALVEVTQKGLDFINGRVEVYVPSQKGKRAGAHWRATWLAALPRTNDVRLTGPASVDGSNFW